MFSNVKSNNFKKEKNAWPNINVKKSSKQSKKQVNSISKRYYYVRHIKTCANKMADHKENKITKIAEHNLKE